MESLEAFRPPQQRSYGGSSQPSASSSSRPSKYQFVDLTDSPTPSPEPESQSQSSQSSSQHLSQHSQSSQGSSSSSRPLGKFQRHQKYHPSLFEPVPLGSGSRPPPVHRSPFAPFPTYREAPVAGGMSHNQANGGIRDRPLVPGDVNTVIDLTKPGTGEGFGSSILKSTSSKSAKSSHGSQNRSYGDYIKPGKGAFQRDFETTHDPRFPASRPPATQPNSQWPAWLTTNGNYQMTPDSHPVQRPPTVTRPVDDEPQGETFDLNNVQYTQADYERHQGDADEHMRELLSGAIGDGEEDMGDDKVKEGEDVVEGFADGVRLMPHQVRGVRWMKGRESGRKYGGILADDMGLGKTVQALARIVDGKATTAERKAGWKAGTLIIAPLAVMEQWATEAKTKTKPGVLRVTTHHGPSRTKSGKVLEDYDVVITTFQTVSSEYSAWLGPTESQPASRAQSESDGDSDDSLVKKIKKKPVAKKKKASHALFDTKWLRVVVDEAQNIKNRKTKAAKAAVALKAKYRWCLTGTPIQNNVEELFSLFHFLRAKPLDNWDVFRARISSLVKDGRTAMAMKRLHVVLKALMLRRTKEATIDGKPILNLPARKVEVVHCPFDDEERDFYTALQEKTTVTFNKFLRSGTVMSNYTSVLTMLLRLRQACDHPSLVAKALSTDKDAIENKPKSKDDDDDSGDELADLLGGLGVDKEKKCEVCFAKLEKSGVTQCPECQEIAERALAKTENGLPPDSAKIRMLLQLLNEVEERSAKKEKTIVFSQFTSFLNLVEPFLKSEGISYVRYDGSMRNDKRQESLEQIKTSPNVRVILISFKAGSTGLNLTCCNNVILMDLWWNPALEDQAFDRAHRLGQKLDVNIWKLTVEDTVEDRILELQNVKRELAAAALSGQTVKNTMKLTLNDIMALFRSSD